MRCGKFVRVRSTQNSILTRPTSATPFELFGTRGHSEQISGARQVSPKERWPIILTQDSRATMRQRVRVPRAHDLGIWQNAPDTRRVSYFPYPAQTACPISCTKYHQSCLVHAPMHLPSPPRSRRLSTLWKPFFFKHPNTLQTGYIPMRCCLHVRFLKQNNIFLYLNCKKPMPRPISLGYTTRPFESTYFYSNNQCSSRATRLPHSDAVPSSLTPHPSSQ